jgi:hypothetical protein
MTVLMALAALGPAHAGEETRTTQAYTISAISHGAWLAGAGASAATGEPGGLGLSAAATHVNLLIMPVYLHQLQPADPDDARRLEQAWTLYYVGLGVTAAGWGLVGLTAEQADGVPGLVVMALADVALMGATGLVTREMVRKDIDGPPPTPVLPLVVTRF